jgi:intracellular septation protein A
LQFFKSLLKTSFLRLTLSHAFSYLIFSLIILKVFCPQACTVPSLFSFLKGKVLRLATAVLENYICITLKVSVLYLALSHVLFGSSLTSEAYVKVLSLA